MFLAAMMTPLALAQDANPGGDNSKPAAPAEQGPGRGDRGDRGNRGGDFRERMTTMMKERLGNPSEDEWKVIEPKLQKVLQARGDAMGGRGMFGGRRGGNRGDRNGADDNSDQKMSPVQQASSDLQKTLDNKSATAEEITAKLTALREAKEKAKTTLAAAQKDLKEVLTQRQEAALVMMGMLD
jgi:hypothetical protein